MNPPGDDELLTARQRFDRLARLYPRRYRQRYGVPLCDTLLDQYRELPYAERRGSRYWVRQIGDAATNALVLHVVYFVGDCRMTFAAMKKPSAWVPLIMSLAALALVLGHVAIYGAVREADEGSAAHIFQLLMIAQVPVVAYFAIVRLPQTPRQGLQVLALQGVAALAALAPVFYFNL